MRHVSKALIVLALEIVVLGLVIAVYLASAGPDLRQPSSIALVSPVRAVSPVIVEVPVSITVRGAVGRVQSAALVRGGRAQSTTPRAGRSGSTRRTTR